MDRLKSVVVAVDFTPCSACALAQAVRISSWNRATLQVVHVIETLAALDMQEMITPYIAEIQDGLIAEARSIWNGFASDVSGKAGLDVAIVINNPLTEIMDRLNRQNADLLVLGSHGVSPADRGAGILATQCVRKAPCRVLLVRDKHSGTFRNVIACVDFSETSRDALDSAVRIAAQDNATLHVIHVFQPPWKRLRFKALETQAAANFPARYEETLLAKLKEFCAATRADVAWTKPTFALVQASSHGAGITQYARANACDLAVLGTRGHTNLRDILLGSTAERVIRDAPCSILAIKPRD
jgi:universal stress protein E